LVGLQKAEHAGDVLVEAIQRAERFLDRLWAASLASARSAVTA
jgi:hypothetical protein